MKPASDNNSPLPPRNAWDQPKPTGEWTAADVLQMGCDRADPAYTIADAHNAALAAAVDQWTRSRCFVTLESYERLEQRAAAQQPLVDALRKCEKVLNCPDLHHARASKAHVEAWKAARIALANVKEGKV